MTLEQAIKRQTIEEEITRLREELDDLESWTLASGLALLIMHGIIDEAVL